MEGLKTQPHRSAASITVPSLLSGKEPPLNISTITPPSSTLHHPDISGIAALELKDIHHHFYQGDNDLHILRGVNLTINEGEVVGLVGQSGSGKSTLLHIAGLLEAPSSGQVCMNGKACHNANDMERTLMRRLNAGFVYQAHHLLPEFSALENVIIPQIIAGKSKKEAKEYAQHLLGSLGLSSRLSHRPQKLSGGEQQRVAIARALANKPKILIADEPTGNLDPKTADSVFESFQKLASEKKVSALIATHNMDLARQMSRRVNLVEGTLV